MMEGVRKKRRKEGPRMERTKSGRGMEGVGGREEGRKKVEREKKLVE